MQIDRTDQPWIRIGLARRADCERTRLIANNLITRVIFASEPSELPSEEGERPEACLV